MPENIVRKGGKNAWVFCPEIIAGFGSEIFAILKFYIFSSGLAPTRANASDAI